MIVVQKREFPIPQYVRDDAKGQLALATIQLPAPNIGSGLPLSHPPYYPENLAEEVLFANGLVVDGHQDHEAVGRHVGKSIVPEAALVLERVLALFGGVDLQDAVHHRSFSGSTKQSQQG